MIVFFEYNYIYNHTIENKKIYKYIDIYICMLRTGSARYNFAHLFACLHRNEKLNSLILPNTSAGTLHILF